MARKLNHNGYGRTSRNVGINIVKVAKNDGSKNSIKNWEKQIKNLMSDFCFENWQMEDVINKAKELFLPWDDEEDKYNKAWKVFKEEMMLSV